MERKNVYTCVYAYGVRGYVCLYANGVRGYVCLYAYGVRGYVCLYAHGVRGYVCLYVPDFYPAPVLRIAFAREYPMLLLLLLLLHHHHHHHRSAPLRFSAARPVVESRLSCPGSPRGAWHVRQRSVRPSPAPMGVCVCGGGGDGGENRIVGGEKVVRL